MSKSDNTLVLAHYYTIPEVQAAADFVGDSLDLAMKALEEKPERIVFAGVRFMAETAKILNPETEVILPDEGSTCSLVEQTDIEALRRWVDGHEAVHVSYINSSAAHKAMSDIIVTSRIVEDVIADIYRQGLNVIFSPDRNMGEYLNFQNGYEMPVWTAVCEVHDQFKAEELEKEYRKWTDGPKYLLAHPESPLPVLKMADFVGSTHGMLNWIEKFEHRVGTIYVATEDGLLYNMRQLRPELDIRQAPIYTGCQCNSCHYMKMNTFDTVNNAINGVGGMKIDYMDEQEMEAARLPVERMLDFQRTGIVNLEGI